MGCTDDLNFKMVFGIFQLASGEKLVV